ncbi:MAG: NADH-quinone oxidoreductase subunit NuoF [Anaerolineaceae bacterium]|jgi:NADH-quinone oxidoreductase subunit F|nr:NADH-quinone oxidoreductase subunit NuoF [Anaerolineaceae bacterium]
MSELDLKPIRKIIDDMAPQGRTALLPLLHEAQDYFGYIPEAVAEEIAQAISVPLADIFGVIEFYSLFFKHPIGETIVHVCNDPACAMAGSESIYKLLNQKESFKFAGEVKPKITIEVSACLGLCEHAPALLVKGEPVITKDLQSWEEIFEPSRKRPQTILGGDVHRLTKNCGKGSRTNLDQYLESGGYIGLKNAIKMPPKDVINQVKESGLVGRGGAAFPTGLKWEGAANANEEIKYLVCNGDEAEPGTFKDRVLMEDDPHLIIEGMLIAGYAIGSQKGYFYIRGEYLTSYKHVKEAVEEARKAGFLGENILGSGFSFDIEIRRGAGAYVCGEETALFESIEGKRGFPRVKPPFPTTHGLFGKPTVINNVETLANIPIIFSMGIEEYKSIGTEKSPGSKLFCLSGDVNKPGLYEVPFGVTLRHVIEKLAGGMRSDHPLQAILIGGAAGAMADPSQLDVSLSFEELRKEGLPLGSGVVTVFDETRDLRDVLFRLANFFAEESCGKCFPCQIGTQRQFEIMRRISKRVVKNSDINDLEDIIVTMTDSSLCGLGQTAGSAIGSAIKKWPALFSNLGVQREFTGEQND